MNIALTITMYQGTIQESSRNRAAVLLNVVGNVCKYRKSAFKIATRNADEHSQLMSNDDKDSCRELQ